MLLGTAGPELPVGLGSCWPPLAVLLGCTFAEPGGLSGGEGCRRPGYSDGSCEGVFLSGRWVEDPLPPGWISRLSLQDRRFGGPMPRPRSACRPGGPAPQGVGVHCPCYTSGVRAGHGCGVGLESFAVKSHRQVSLRPPRAELLSQETGGSAKRTQSSVPGAPRWPWVLSPQPQRPSSVN